jgi:hypothetical protein
MRHIWLHTRSASHEAQGNKKIESKYLPLKASFRDRYLSQIAYAYVMQRFSSQVIIVTPSMGNCLSQCSGVLLPWLAGTVR